MKEGILLLLLQSEHAKILTWNNWIWGKKTVKQRLICAKRSEIEKYFSFFNIISFFYNETLIQK